MSSPDPWSALFHEILLEIKKRKDLEDRVEKLEKRLEALSHIAILFALNKEKK